MTGKLSFLKNRQLSYLVSAKNVEVSPPPPMGFSSSTPSAFPNKVNVEQVDVSNANPDRIKKLSI